jgi:hypothetical protein
MSFDKFIKAYKARKTKKGKDDRCWEGYEPVPGKKPYSEGSCRPKKSMKKSEEEDSEKKPLNKPIRTPNADKKFKVYVKDPDTGNVNTVRFGDQSMEIKRDDKERRQNFRARHNCDDPGPKTKARYWSCKMWQEGTSVSEMTEKAMGEFLSRYHSKKKGK